MGKRDVLAKRIIEKYTFLKVLVEDYTIHRNVGPNDAAGAAAAAGGGAGHRQADHVASEHPDYLEPSAKQEGRRESERITRIYC